MAAILVVVAVALVVWFIYAAAHSNDGFECETENLERLNDGRPQVDCDS